MIKENVKKKKTFYFTLHWNVCLEINKPIYFKGEEYIIQSNEWKVNKFVLPFEKKNYINILLDQKP